MDPLRLCFVIPSLLAAKLPQRKAELAAGRERVLLIILTVGLDAECTRPVKAKLITLQLPEKRI